MSWCRKLSINPRGANEELNGINARGQSLLLYLQLSDCLQAPTSWMQHVWFKMTVINHMDQALSISKGQELFKETS